MKGIRQFGTLISYCLKAELVFTMGTTLENNKRIAKNTMLLYIRMFVLMAINLYTSRIVLQCLGVEDFGIYGIVGSVVVLFSFLNSAMSTCTSRFLSFYIGQKNEKNTNNVFCASLNLYFTLLFVILFFSETVGLYLVNYVLNIPVDRLSAANWAYQFTIFTFCSNVLRIPYNACIISYEKMDFYAYLSIGEVIAKLGGVFLLLYYTGDRLIYYALMMFIVTSLITFLFYAYCHKNIPTSHYKFYKIDRNQYKELLSFSGWSLFTGVANVASNTGLNMLLNVFWGVTVNAVVGIANQVSNAMYSFVSNFQTAFTPQITKLYAKNELDSCYRLVFHSSKFSYFLFGTLVLPIMIEMPSLLFIWLGQVPEYASSFANLILIYLLIDALFTPLWLFIDATGKIKVHQIVTGLLILSNFPIAFVLLKSGLPPISVWVGRIMINIIANTFRLIYIYRTYKFPSWLYLHDVLLPITIVTFVISIPTYYASLLFGHSLLEIVLFIILSFLYSLLIVYFIGLTKNERIFIKNVVWKKLKSILWTE